ncbi:MAG: type II toxin-antitoxin system VapC family toxin [Gemmatales bacterium]
MNGILLDTHALIWFYHDPAQLSTSAHQRIEQACVNQSGQLFISVISLVEIRYLVERFRLPTQLEINIWAALRDVSPLLQLVSLDVRMVERLEEIPRSVVNDMPDRIIAATALELGLPLITKDEKIRQLTNIQVIW